MNAYIMDSAKKRRLEQLKHDPLLAGSDLPTSSVPPSATAPIPTQNASSLLESTRTGPRLSSGSTSFDSLIVTNDADEVRGLSPGCLLELSGCPGEGKTRVCLSYAIQACVGGDTQDKGIRVLIIDTQGCLSLGALLKAALAANDGDEDLALLCLERIVIWESYEMDDLLIALQSLSGFAQANPSLKLAIIDTLSTPFNANLVPSLSAQIMADYDKTNSKYKNGNNNKNSNKRQRKSYFRSDPRQEASYNIIRHFMTGLLKDTLMAVTARNIAVIVTTQSKTKLTDEFGERAAGVRDAKHSFAIPQFFNNWHIPLATQVILSAAGDGTRTAMTTVTPSSIRGHNVAFRTTDSGIVDL